MTNYLKEIKDEAEKIISQGYKSVCFWLPVRSIGGGTPYFVLLAKYLMAHTDLKVYYMDYTDGYAHDLFTDDEPINFLAYNPTVDWFPVCEPMVVVTNTTRVIQIKNMHPDSKLLFWHFETVPCAWDIVLMHNEAKKFIKAAKKDNAIVFHDWSSREVINSQFSLNFKDKEYLSVYCEPKGLRAPENLIDSNTINIGWLGRLSRDKICSLYNLVDNVAKIDDRRKIRLHIIGNGVCRKEVEKYCSKYQNIDFVFYGTIKKHELDELLINCIDILFAMGTSLIDAAALGIPAVMVQISSKPFEDDQFIWLYDTKEYCVGILNEQKKKFAVKYTRFNDIISEIYDKGGKAKQGNLCYDYFIQNHSSTEAIVYKFLKFCLKTSFTFKKLKECIKYTPYNKMEIRKYTCHRIPIWSIIKYKNEKTFKAFGLTIMKISWEGNDKIFMPFGIRPLWHRYVLKGYPFPNSQYKDALRGKVEEVPIFDLKNANAYKKQKRIKEIRQRISQGQKAKICLFVSRLSCWSMEQLYNLLEVSPYFEPTIVVKPFMNQGKEAMIDYMDTTYDALNAKGLRVIKTYDKATDTFLDIKETLDPDIVFYTKYWRPQFHENYYITNFLDRPTFYTSYCFDIAKHDAVMNYDLNNAVDKYFMASDIHKEMAQNVMKNGAENVCVSGAPKLDLLLDNSGVVTDVWKQQNKVKKRIIWAPHHSDAFPNNLYQFNAFFELSEYMLELAERYKDSVQFAFKPHPMLKPKLNEKWGKEEADRYYQIWEERENTQLETGEFIDLFKTSDAMIFDSISFIAEYTAVNKPALFTIGAETRVQLNDFGMINFEVLYKTSLNLKKDIDEFVKKVVIEGVDEKREARENFIQDYLQPPHGKTASENIYDCICEVVLDSETEVK